MNFFIKYILPLVDFLVAPFVFLSACLLKVIRRLGVHRMRISREIFRKIGVFPIRNHYYEPQFVFSDDNALNDRMINGIDLCIDDQLKLIEKLIYADEVKTWPRNSRAVGSYFLDNRTFASGDAEFLYQMVRHTKPRRLYEIGSGYSTLVAAMALEKNRSESHEYQCHHVCIEPYEQPWLESKVKEVIRKRVEEINIDFFKELQAGDILFVDSSHIIRPKGDVLFIYLAILPVLRKGVVVHVHDIFTPRNYLQRWIVDEVSFWNEQYLLEAFLCQNPSWKVIASLNHLHHHHNATLASICPHLTRDREPGSFYIQKIS